MSTAQPETPAFGAADLSNCEREQIQFAGSIQPHGALLVVSEPALTVVQASANARAMLGLLHDPVGQPLDTLPGDLAAGIRSQLKHTLERVPAAIRCNTGTNACAFDVLVHRTAERELIVELEPAGPSVDLVGALRERIDAIGAAGSVRDLAGQTARMLKALLGYDRVMVYRFDEDGNGEVFSEAREQHLEPFLGNHYPASDIPRNARRLYERNRIRVLPDVEYTPIALAPELSPITQRPLDMSLCGLRSMSPIHLQYLKNMGVRATLVASLMVGEKLWGLIACHHYTPRKTQYEKRVACELLAECVATRIAALQSYAQVQAELAVRRIEQRMIETIRRDGDWRSALFDGSDTVLKPVNATGAALVLDEQVISTGDVPSTQDVLRIASWLGTNRSGSLYATTSLAREAPELGQLSAVASGLIATSIGQVNGDYLMWFRPEQVRTVTWGGDPNKPMVFGNDPRELSPRRSFAQWHQQVHNSSTDWSTSDLTAARMVGESVADVIVQFHSVRMLILEDQLEQMGDKVRGSAHCAVIADAQGRVLLVSDAFERLLGAGRPQLQWLDQLPEMFTDAEPLLRGINALMSGWTAWRGEVSLGSALHDSTPLLLRADPVFSEPDRVLGFVLVFTDLSQRKAAEAARLEFQRSALAQRPSRDGEYAHRGDPDAGQLMVGVVENAQLAALEICDGVDLEQMPSMLNGVHSSMTRTAELLEHLIDYAVGDEDVSDG